MVIVQLYSNGQCHGVHGIVVQMRDFETNQLVPGVRLAECGHKIGMNGELLETSTVLLAILCSTCERFIATHVPVTCLSVLYNFTLE